MRRALVESLARPGRNFTGLATNPSSAIFGKQLELLKETVPRVTRVAVLANSANLQSPPQLEETRNAASRLGVTLITVDVIR